MATASRVGRIGGVAVALGIGAVVATGLAADAAASPSDTGRSSGSSSQAEAGHGDAARTPPGLNRGSRSSAAPGGASVVVAKPAASVVESPTTAVVRSSARPVGRVPAAVRSSVAMSVPVAAEPVAPQIGSGTSPVPAASLNPVSGFFDALKNLFCDPRGKRITFLKGTHFAIPPSFGYFVREVSGTGTFTADSVYDLGDVDQYDWNKFTGIAFTPLEPDRDSVMVGWRYNLTSQEFEIAPFYNVNKARILPTPPDVISIPADQTFDYLVDYTGVTLTYGDTTVFKAFPASLTPNVWTASRVSGWFGGNEVAPRTLSYYLKID